MLSARAEATTRRTYNRPLDDEGTQFETWEQTVDRSHYQHHAKLWEDAAGSAGRIDKKELNELNALGMSRKGLVAGRTLWLGGTPYAYERAASQFNCSGLELTTVYDMVDGFWLLLNGCGVGGLPRAGTLRGYDQPIPSIQIIPSERDKNFRGRPENIEVKPNIDNDLTWTIQIGDSGMAWAKCLGKLLQPPKGRVKKLVLDFSNVRGRGGRLKGYGWICNGFNVLADALAEIHNILNQCAGNLLTEEEIMDIFNICGTVLSSRRSAQAGLLDAHHPHAEEFSRRKHEYWRCKACGSHNTRGGRCLECGRRETNDHRRQSNNSLLFWKRPSVDDLCDLLYMNLTGGEPGFVNATAALRRCPWFRVFNPCLTGDTLVSTEHGYQKIRDMADKTVKVVDGNGKLTPALCRKTAENAPVITVTVSSGEVIRCTPNHHFVLRDGKKVEAITLVPGTVLMPSAPYKYAPDRDFGHTLVEKPGGPTVVSVVDRGEREDVFCFRVPTTASFDLRTVHSGNCFEIMLPSCGFCNLVSLCLPAFNKNFHELERAVWVMARANYRQTCVDLQDGVLQPRWHQTNESLALCGVSFTGIVQAGWLTDYQIIRLRNAAVTGAYSMADELGRPRPKAITTIKPEGTRSKITNWGAGYETAEGMHSPLGRYIFNWINFSTEDPLVNALRDAGYKTMLSPSDANNVLVRFPVEYANVPGLVNVKGREVNLEPATDQLRRYLRWNTLWADHNVSSTISFDETEVPDLAKLIHSRWDDGYIATAFLRRADPTLTAADLGHPYLPQEVVSAEDYHEAISAVKPIQWEQFHRGIFDMTDTSDCPTGVCPVK